MGDEGVAQVIDFGVLDAGFFEITVDGGPDVSDKQGMAGFGDKNMIVVYGRPDGEVVLQGRGSGFVEGDGSLGVVFEGANGNLIFADVFHVQIGQFADSDTGLEKELDNGGDPNIQAGDVSKGAVLGFG